MPSGTVYGTSIGGSHSATISSETARFGTLPIVRHFFSGMPGSVPSGLTTSMIYVPSFKGSATNYTAMAAGTWDSAIQTWLRALPSGQTVWACYYHEPEDNCQPEAKTGFTLAGWRAAADHFNNLVHTTSGVVATVKACQIFMAFTLGGGKGRNINNYLPTMHTPDLLGFDFDGITGYPDQSSLIATAQALATSKGIPWFVAEFGASPASTDSTHAGRTSWNNTTAAQFSAAGAAAVAYWDSDAVWLSQSNEITAWAALVAATPPTTPAAPTGVTCTPASDGLTATIAWSALPGGVDHLDAYIQGPGQTFPHKINTSGTIAITPRSYTFATTPGDTYSPGVALVASADAGGTNRSGYSAFASFSAPNPGAGGHAPIINSSSATQDATNPLLYHLASSGTDPDGGSLAYLWTFIYPADPTVLPVTLPTASGDITLPNAGAWNWTLTLTNATLTTPQSGSVQTNPSGNTSFLDMRVLQHGESVLNMAFVEQDAKPKLDTWARGIDGRQSPHNAKYGLSGSSFSADSISGSAVAAMLSGYLFWWSFTLEDTQLSELLFATSVAQNGSGAVVGVHDSSGLLLGDFNGIPASGTDVDAGFSSTAAFGIVVPLDLQVLNRTWGETLFGQAFFPSGMSTYPTFRVSGVGGSAARIGSGATTPLWGILSGQSAYANDLSTLWPSWTSQAQIWAGAQ